MKDLFPEAYTETRRVLAGLAECQPPYKALIDWIAGQPGGANVINVVYWMFAGRPCLLVVMERESDVTSFAGGEFVNLNVQRKIVDRFHEILAEQRNTRIVTERLIVLVKAFAPGARIEANHNVPREAIAVFQYELADPSIWLIRPHFENLRVFFYTNDQLEASKRTSIRERIAKEYQTIIAPYDEFGYVAEMPIDPVFDSRERFEAVYRGNWQGYDRDNP